MMRIIRTLWISFLMGALALASAAAESRVALKGHVSKQLETATKLERVRADEPVQLSLVVRLDESLLKQTLDQLYGPNAPANKKFLSSSEFAQKFAIADKREKLKRFAQANGLTVDAAQDRTDSMIVKVSGNASVVEKTFSVELHHYRDAKGQVFRAHETEPMIPISLVPHLSAVMGLSNLRGVLHTNLRASPISNRQIGAGKASANAAPSALVGTAPGGSLAPNDIKTIYALNQTTLNGSGQSVAVLELDTGYNPADIAAYESQFNLPNPTLTFVGVDGDQNLCGGLSCVTQSPYNDEAMLEVALDMEMVVALAPHLSQVLVYDGPNTNQGVLDTYNQIALDNTAKVVSTSWGIAELYSTLVQAESQVFQRMAAQGQTIYAASGDNGAYSDGSTLSVLDPASQPYVTATGGTSLSGTVQAPVETVWSGSGGGVSAIWNLPSYQTSLAGAASQQFRNVPDVALNADPASGYGIYVGGGWWQVGGTSAAAPLWAGMTALINQQRLASGKGYFGFANPNLYLLGANNSNLNVFHDITSGNNEYYSAGPGYDNATGWGSYIGSAMIGSGSQSFPTVVISTPTAGHALSGVVAISGTASASAFSNYKVEYSSGASSTTFHLIGSVHTSSVTNNVLENWNTASLPAGLYALKLTLVTTSSQTYSDTVSPLYIDRSSPTVAIVSPLPNAAEVGVVTASATATDDTGIAHVDFWVDQLTAEGTATAAPYLVTFNTVGLSSGTHTLTAKAFDVTGKSASASIPFVVVADTLAPTIPSNVTMLAESPSEFYLYWTASTDNVGVAGYRVDLSTNPQFTSFVPGYQNLNVAASDYPSTFFLGLSPQTIYYARVRAYDSALNVSANSLVAQATTLPSPPPYLSISYPYPGATVFGRQEVDVYTYSQTSSIQRVDYSVDAKSPISVSTYPYTFYWDTTALPNGSHQLTATVYDITGASSSIALPLVVSNQVVFQDNFNDNLFSSWTVIDDGNLSAPSHWQVVNGALTQTSAIHGSDTTLRLGTQAVTGGPSWTDYSVNLHMTPTYGDIGVIFRRQDNNNYYRFSMSSDGYMYLTEILGGTVGFLNNYPMAYVPNQPYSVTIDVKGYMLRVFVNGQLVQQANSASFSSGGIGLYTYDTTGASFDDVQVLSSSIPDGIPPAVHITSPANGAQLSGIATIAGTASDNVGVSSVTLLADGQAVGVASGTIAWSDKLDTTLVGNGTHTLTAVAYDFAGNQSSASISVTISNPGQAAYNTALLAPACTALGSVCDSGGLLNGRDSLIGSPEPHQPNTIHNSCADGTAGTYHTDESNDRLKVSTVDGQPFAAGKSVKVEATVWAYSGFTADALDLYYTATASSPTWTYLATLVPSGPGVQVLSSTYSLPTGTLQAVRAGFRYSGTVSPCSPGSYDDHDDLVFAASPPPPPPNPPTGLVISSVTATSFDLSWAASTGPIAGYRVDVSTQPLFVNFINGYNNKDLGNVGNTFIAGLSSQTTYYARLRAYGVGGNVSANSVTVSTVTLFQDTIPPVVSITSPVNGATIRGSVTIAARATDNVAVSFVQFYIDGVLKEVDSTLPYESDNNVVAAGTHTVTAIAQDTSGLRASASISVTVIPDTTTPTVSITSPANGAFVRGTVDIKASAGDDVALEEVDFRIDQFSKLIDRSTGPYHYLWNTLTEGATSHVIYVTALDTSLNSRTSSITVVVDNQAPTAPSGILVSSVAYNSFTVRWQAASDNIGVSGYQLDVSSVSTFSPLLSSYNNKNLGNAVSATITGLISGTTYYGRLRAYDAAGNVSINSSIFIAALPNNSGSGGAFFVKLDTTTQGTWKGTYGVDGEAIEGDSSNYPAYAKVTIAGDLTYAWANSTTDVRALQKNLSATDRIAACWYSTASFTMDINLTDGHAHQIALYILDWDNDGAGGVGRTQRMDVTDATTGALLDSRSVGSFQKGQYFIWNLQGHVKIMITNLNNSNAVVSGIFFGTPDPNRASFVKFDTTTQGTWKGTYGVDGEAIEGDSSNYPAYAKVTIAGDLTYAWANSTTDVRALQKNLSATDRIAACWYSTASFTMDINLTDGHAHQIALYILDWDNNGAGGVGRMQRMDVTDATTGALLDSRSVGSFQKGQYFIWNLQGHVKIMITNLNNSNAVVSGIFFGVQASTTTNQAGSLPAPAITSESVLPVNGLLQAQYPNSYDVQSFSWQIAASAPLVSGQAPRVIPNVIAQGSAASLTTAISQAGLSPLNLPPGTYRVLVSVQLRTGQISPTSAASITLMDASASAASVRVRPNPFKAHRGDLGIIFDQMAPGSTVKIFTVSARWVVTLQAPSGSVSWNLTNDSGDRVASGLYLYLITDPQGDKTHGKLAIIR